MATTNSVNLKSSRYVAGGTTEVSATSLEWWDRKIFQSDASDLLYVVESSRIARIDRIAYDFYGDSKLWWFIAQYNNVLDPISEIVEGRVLRIPTKDRMQSMMSNALGGVQSTREPISTITPIVS